MTQANTLSVYASYSTAADHLKKVGVWGSAASNTSIWQVLQDWINLQEWKASTLEDAIGEVNSKLQELGIYPYAQARPCIGGIIAFKLRVNGYVFTFAN
jgi:hypothetical protein